MSVALRDLPLLGGLPDPDVRAIGTMATRRRLAPGEELVREGELAGELYVLLSGRADVSRRDPRGVEHVIGSVQPGEIVGEMALLEGRPRSASVRATEPCEVLVLPFRAVRDHPGVLANLARARSARLRDHGDVLLEAAQERAAMGELLVKVLVLLCSYAVLLSGLPALRAAVPGATTSVISLPVIGLFGFASWRFLRKTGWPLSRFGLGAKGLLGSLAESLLLTPPLLALLTGVKWLVVRYVPSFRGQPVIEHVDSLAAVWARLSQPDVVQLLAVYGASAAVQEMIVRCALQASLEDFLVGRRRAMTAIVVSALMFSVNHLHMSFAFAALAFLPGLFWGWMFQRRRHLVGPTLSHFAVGAYVFFVLGVRLQ